MSAEDGTGRVRSHAIDEAPKSVASPADRSAGSSPSAPTAAGAAGVQVPLLDLRAQFATIRDEVMAAITRVCESQRFILGPEGAALEREMADMLQVREAIGVSSGTDALLVALMAATASMATWPNGCCADADGASAQVTASARPLRHACR